jgi:ATP-dependent protease HslVU (ClpYQ) peptidase subunit
LVVMTWVVGTPTIFGYAFGISDVRVTLGDKTEIDCLQKIYPIGRHVVAAFAGSVKIGFAMLDRLRELTDYPDENIAAEPEGIKQDWPRYAREVFGAFRETERELECHLMIMVVDSVSASRKSVGVRESCLRLQVTAI